MNFRKLRRHLYIAPLLAAAVVAALTAYAGIPHDGHASAIPATAMSVPF